MIRHCPNCDTERPLTELFCEGVIDGHNCGWDLSTVDITERGAPRPPTPAPAPPPETLMCRNGHPVFPGDIICGTCGEPVDLPEVQPPPPAPEPQPLAPETIIEGWRLLDRMPSSSLVRERFASIRDADNQRGVLTLYAPGSEPDQAVYDVLQRLPRDHVPEIFVHGRWCDRAYEVCEEFTGGSLADLAVDPADQSAIRSVIRELADSLHALAETGLRHRDLRPSVVFVRSRNPLDLVIGGFGSARLSEFDLDIASPLETTRYMAPETIAGGVAPASDWWSLGMIVLEKITKGACFEGVNEHAFLIHVLTSGVPLPDDLDPSLNLLLRTLRTQSHASRAAPLLLAYLRGLGAPNEVSVVLAARGHGGGGLRRFTLRGFGGGAGHHALKTGGRPGRYTPPRDLKLLLRPAGFARHAE